MGQKQFDAFLHIYEIGLFEIENHKSILRRLVNCFPKGYSNKMSDKFKRISSDKNSKQGSLRKTRMSSTM